MVVEVQNLNVADNHEVWIGELKRLDLSQFDLESKQYTGQVYRLGIDSIKVIADAIGFTAKFDHTSVQSACFDAWKGQSVVTFEMARNTRPIDVGLRYMADRWSPVERSSKQKSARPAMRLRYESTSLPASAWEMLADRLKFNTEEHDWFYIRINFKDFTYILITEEENKDKLPGGSIHAFTLPGSLTKQAAETIDSLEATEKTSKTNDLVFEPGALTESGQSNTQTKYAPYSRSEIDLLFKKHAEAIVGYLNPKITNQQKNLQEILKSEQAKTAKIMDELYVYCEDVRKRLEHAEAKHLNTSQKLVDQASKQLLFEIEQFKSYLNKQVSLLLKSLDSRILAAINTEKEKSKPRQDNSAFIVAGLALVISICNIVAFYILMKH